MEWVVTSTTKEFFSQFIYYVNDNLPAAMSMAEKLKYIAYLGTLFKFYSQGETTMQKALDLISAYLERNGFGELGQTAFDNILLPAVQNGTLPQLHYTTSGMCAIMKTISRDNTISTRINRALAMTCAQCGQPAKLTCGQCLDQLYCSKTCAQKGWTNGHKKQCQYK